VAKQTIVRLVDDLDGSSATVTIPFSLEGTAYTIDLSEANADRMRAAFAPYVQAGERVSGPRGKRSRAAAARAPRNAAVTAVGESSAQRAAIRSWAQQNGYRVSDRGRIGVAVRDAYRDAHRSGATSSAPTAPLPAAAQAHPSATPAKKAAKAARKTAKKTPARKVAAKKASRPAAAKRTGGRTSAAKKATN